MKEEMFFNVTVSRENLLEDAVERFSKSDLRDWRKPLKIKFEGEDGVDEGGLTKEFCSLVVSKFLNDMTIFTFDKSSNRWWFSPPRYKLAPSHGNKTKLVKEEVPVNLFELFGTLIGISIYNGVYLDLKFPIVVFKYMLYLNTKAEAKPSMDDFSELKPLIAESLKKLKTSRELKQIDEVFAVSTEVLVRNGSFQEANTPLNAAQYRRSIIEEELKPNGANIPVNSGNVDEFIELYIKKVLLDTHWLEIQSIARGFQKVMACPALSLCKARELKLLLCGIPNFDNFAELVTNTTYIDGFSRDTPVIIWFWDMVLETYTEVHRRKLLFFATGNDRIPTNGFKGLRFVIQKANSHNDDHLPTAHTCFNTLCFPEYSSKDILFNRFQLALDNLTGFGLA